MTRVVRHKQDSGHVLFRFPYFDSLNSCDDRVICLSERSMSIILNALEFSDKMRTRVFNTQVGDLYETVNDEEWSNFQYWVSTVRTELGGYLVCNEFLERIAIALEEANEQAEHEVLNLADLAEAFGAEPSEDILDLLEAFEYLGTVIPGLPDISIPKVQLPTWIGEMRFKGAVLQLLNDIAISQRGQTVALGGADVAGLYADLGGPAEKMVLKAGYVGYAYFLWRWVSNDVIPGWVTWVTSLSGLIFGSIRGGIYDTVEAIEALELGVTLPEMAPVINVECSSCGSSEPCGCGSGVGSPGSSGAGTFPQVPTTTEDDGSTNPSEEDFEDYAAYRVYKCRASYRLILDFIHDLRTFGTLSIVTTLALALATVAVGVMLSPIPFDGVVFIVTLLIAAGAIQTYLVTLADTLDPEVETMVCLLYDSSNAETARTAIVNYVEGVIVSLSMPDAIEGYVTSIVQRILSQDAFNRVFDKSADGDNLPEGDTDCTECEPEECTPLATMPTVEFGNETWATGELTLEAEEVEGWGCSPAYEIAFYSTSFFTLTGYDILSGDPLNVCGSSAIYHASASGTGYGDSPYSENNTGLAAPQTVSHIYLLSSTPFTYKFYLCEPPE